MAAKNGYLSTAFSVEEAEISTLPSSRGAPVTANASLTTAPRLIAIILSIGGLFWGVVLLTIAGPIVLVVPFTAAGYLVTAGYLMRAIWVPPLTARWIIWMASIAVQTLWLCLIVPQWLREQNPADGLLTVSWWVFATVTSFIAFFSEQEEP